MTNIIILFSVLLCGLLTIFILNAIINSRMKNKFQENVPPMAIYCLKAASFVSSGFLLSEINPIFRTLINVLKRGYVDKAGLLRECSYLSIYLGIVVLASILIIWLASLMFSMTSKGGNVFMEIANNNLNAVILFCGILFALTAIIKSGITPLLEEFIPYPTLPIYH